MRLVAKGTGRIALSGVENGQMTRRVGCQESRKIAFFRPGREFDFGPKSRLKLHKTTYLLHGFDVLGNGGDAGAGTLLELRDGGLDQGESSHICFVGWVRFSDRGTRVFRNCFCFWDCDGRCGVLAGSLRYLVCATAERHGFEVEFLREFYVELR